MKNFYDQQDTNLNIRMVLSPTKDKDFPDILLKINAVVLHEGILTESTAFKQQCTLMDVFKISLELRNKNYKYSSGTAVSIDSLKIDDFDIVPDWTQLASYHNDSNVTAPTNYLGFNGTWSLEITEPFYRWQHKITGQGWLLKP
jgi:hypothetical protein